MRITPRICRAARALAGWSQTDLAEQSDVPLPTIMGFEHGDATAGGKPKHLQHTNNDKVVGAFETAGVEFIEANGGGPGVRLKA